MSKTSIILRDLIKNGASFAYEIQERTGIFAGDVSTLLNQRSDIYKRWATPPLEHQAGSRKGEKIYYSYKGKE